MRGEHFQGVGFPVPGKLIFGREVLSYCANLVAERPFALPLEIVTDEAAVGCCTLVTYHEPVAHPWLNLEEIQDGIANVHQYIMAA